MSYILYILPSTKNFDLLLHLIFSQPNEQSFMIFLSQMPEIKLKDYQGYASCKWVSQDFKLVCVTLTAVDRDAKC